MGFIFQKMIKGQKKAELTAEAVLKRISEYDVFKMYMPNPWKINQVCLSPFRKEEHPSFIIGNRGGGLHFIDFADTSKKGDCFEFVQQLHSCDFNTALRIVDKAFGLGFHSQDNLDKYKTIRAEYKQPEELGKRYSLIQVQARKFTKEELAYWNLYHQDITDLRREDIYSIDKLYLNKKLFSLKETELRFGYFYDGHWKIYRPFESPKLKWLPNNVPITTLEGKENIVNCDVSFIAKSKKDKMVVLKVYEHTCAVQNEGIACFSPENVEFLKSNSKRQVLGFDSDVPGVKNSQQITKLLDFDYMNTPRPYLSDGINDFAELGKDYGMNAVEKLFKKKGLI
jgi:DNA primase